jgi:hypothetical protein
MTAFPRDYPWMDPSCPACTATLTAGEETSHRIEHGHGCDCGWLCNQCADVEYCRRHITPPPSPRLRLTTRAKSWTAVLACGAALWLLGMWGFIEATGGWR